MSPAGQGGAMGSKKRGTSEGDGGTAPPPPGGEELGGSEKAGEEHVYDYKRGLSTSRVAEAAVADAFIERYTSYVRRIGRTAPPEVLLRALATSDDVNGLAIALGTAGRQAAGAADPLAAARLRAAGARQELLQRAGGAYQAHEVARMLGVTRQAVHGRFKRGSLLGLPQGDAEILYPACQFTRDGQVVAGLAEVLRAFRVASPWTRLAVLVAPTPALGGRTPLDALAAGDRAGAAQAARAYGEHLA
jgi:hypothetical protein